jgi:hypothetical protein
MSPFVKKRIIVGNVSRNLGFLLVFHNVTNSAFSQGFGKWDSRRQ